MLFFEIFVQKVFAAFSAALLSLIPLKIFNRNSRKISKKFPYPFPLMTQRWNYPVIKIFIFLWKYFL